MAKSKTSHLPLIDASSGTLSPEDSYFLRAAPDGTRFRKANPDGSVWIMKRAGDNGVSEFEELETPPRRAQTGTAMVTGTAARIAGTGMGAIIGARRGMPMEGAAAGSMFAEPLADSLEKFFTGKPQTPVGPWQMATAGITGAMGANVGRSVIGGATREGMIQGGVQSGLTELGRGMDAGYVDPANVAGATVTGTALGGLIGKFLGKDPALSKKLSPEAERQIVAAAKPKPIEPTPIGAAKQELAKTSSELAERPATMEMGMKPVLESAEGTGPARQRGLVASVKESPEFTDEFKAAIDGFYNQKSNNETYARVNQLIEDQGINGARIIFAADKGASAESNALGLELMRRYQKEGKLEDFVEMTDILKRRVTSQGQATQIMATLSKSTPEGMAMYAQKVKGDKLTPDEARTIFALQEKAQKATTAETQLARSAETFEYISKMSPSTFGQKARGWSNIAMLLNPKTMMRNLGGNTVMQGFEMAADGLAVPFDAGLSVFTQKGAVYGPQILERMKGIAQPLKDFKAGYDEAAQFGMSPGKSALEGLKTMSTLAKVAGGAKLDVGDMEKMYRSTFSNPVANALEKTLTVTMGVPDRAFFTSAYRASLANRMRAARDAGEGLVVPDADMIAGAQMDAAKAVFQDDNFVSRGLNKLRQAGNEISTGGKSPDIGAGQALLPFTQVPGSILLRGAEFSPVGYIRSLYEMVAPTLSSRNFDQKAFIDSFSRATLGTGGLIGAGYFLAKLGVISAVKEEDPDLEALKKGIGWGAYKINASALKRRLLTMDFTPSTDIEQIQNGDVTPNYDWLQPVAMPLAIGAEYALEQNRADKALASGKWTEMPSTLAIAGAAGVKTLEDQPLLQGLSRFMRDAGTNGMAPAVGNALLNVPGQYVPAVLSQMQAYRQREMQEIRGTDEFDTAMNSIASKIPVVAEKMGFAPKYDTLGKLREKYPNSPMPYWFDTFLNPAFIAEIKMNPQAKEVLSIYAQTGERDMVPRVMEQKISVIHNGKPIEVVLDGQQISDYQMVVGRLTNDMYAQLVQSPKFQELPPEGKAKIMGKLLPDINTAAKVMLFGHRPNVKSLGAMDALLMQTIQSREDLSEAMTRSNEAVLQPVK